MKIAFVVHRYPSVSQTFIFNQIVGLIRLGHEVDIYTQFKDSTLKPLKKNVINFDIYCKTYVLPKIPKNRYLRILSLIFQIRIFDILIILFKNRELGLNVAALIVKYSNFSSLKQKKYDVIHCHFGDNGVHGIAIRAVNNPSAKLVTSFHGYDINQNISTNNTHIYNEIFRIGDLFTVNSSYSKMKALSLGCPKSKLLKLPVGVDLSKFQYREFVFNKGEKIQILTVGRLTEKKGIAYSIRAVARLLPEFPNISYNIIGEGELKKELTEIIESLDCADSIKLLGSCDHDTVIRHFQKSHIFILSSITAANGDMEGQGLVLQEAQAVGLPVISTLHNGIPDGVLNEKTGYLVPEKDINTLSLKLRHLIENPDLCLEMGRNGNKFVTENYDILKLNNLLVSYYQSLII